MSIYEELLEPDKLQIVCMKDVEPEDLQFLWSPYIPASKITSIQGDPGCGKTMLTLYLAACVSSGRPFPGEESGRPPAPVLYQTAEDGYADTIHHRLTKMGANMANIHYINEMDKPLTLTDERLPKAMEELHPMLLVIDPLQAYLGAGVDMNRANQVRSVLSPVVQLAAQYKCTVILIMHLNKANVKPIYKGIGSVDFGGCVRSILMMGNNPQDPSQKVLSHVKHNLTAPGDSIALHIDTDTFIVFDGFCDLDAEQILGPTYKKGRSEEGKSIAFLKTYFKDIPYAESSEILAAAAKAGISERTLSRAKQTLKMKGVSLGFHPKTHWWLLPDVDVAEFKKNQKGAVSESPS